MTAYRILNKTYAQNRFQLTAYLVQRLAPVFRQWKFILIFLIIFTYYQTNILVDWENPINLGEKYRPLGKSYLQKPHYEKSDLVNCQHFLKKDVRSNLIRYKGDGRITLHSDDVVIPQLNMSCAAIRNRIIDPFSRNSAELGYAVSRVVYKDYLWLERAIMDNYSPNNSYCFAVDLKSSLLFNSAIEKLASCLENVLVIAERFSYDSNGHFLNFGHWACTELLLKRESWEHILWLQNYDMVLRTNKEMSDIIHFMNGHHGIGHKPAQWKRYNVFKDWTAPALDLWKPEAYITDIQKCASLVVSQNYNEVFLSKELVQFVVENMNYKNLLNALEQPLVCFLLCKKTYLPLRKHKTDTPYQLDIYKARFATDEMFWATLIASPDLDLPGQPVGGCKDNSHYITRHNYWLKWFDYDGCESGFSRHGTCIFALEDLYMLSEKPQLVVNKFMTSFDYGLAICYSDVLRNRSSGILPSPKSLTKTYTGNYTVFC